MIETVYRSCPEKTLNITKNNASNQLKIPDELLLKIFCISSLRFKDLLSCFCVCRHWNQLIGDRQIGSKYLNRIPQVRCRSVASSWVKTYQYWLLHSKYYLIIDCSPSMLMSFFEKISWKRVVKKSELIAKRILSLSIPLTVYLFSNKYVKKNISKVKSIKKILDIKKTKGGTYLTPVIKDILYKNVNHKKEQFSNLIVLSDGYFSDHEVLRRNINEYSQLFKSRIFNVEFILFNHSIEACQLKLNETDPAFNCCTFKLSNVFNIDSLPCR